MRKETKSRKRTKKVYLATVKTVYVDADTFQQFEEIRQANLKKRRVAKLGMTGTKKVTLIREGYLVLGTDILKMYEEIRKVYRRKYHSDPAPGLSAVVEAGIETVWKKVCKK